MDGIRMEQFPFRVLDYKAGEAWLNKLGAAGWPRRCCHSF